MSSSTTRRRILLVDDDRVVATAIARELADHEVTIALGGAEALDVLGRTTSFDLVLCDLVMPEVSGIEVHGFVKAQRPELLDRFVVMTGGASTPRAREFLSGEGPRVIEKPFTMGELRGIVESTPVAS
jgi:DNA-binding NtrC family response regulator